MNCQRITVTGSLLTIGSLCLFSGIQRASQHSAIVLLQTSAILLPVAMLVAAATGAVFSNFFNHPPNTIDTLLGGAIIVIATPQFTFSIANGLGIAVSASTVSAVCLVALLLYAAVAILFLAYKLGVHWNNIANI